MVVRGETGLHHGIEEDTRRWHEQHGLEIERERGRGALGFKAERARARRRNGWLSKVAVRFGSTTAAGHHGGRESKLEARLHFLSLNPWYSSLWVSGHELDSFFLIISAVFLSLIFICRWARFELNGLVTWSRMGMGDDFGDGAVLERQ
ncbi:hypothetical protein M0R45_008875 [Rubus argutus]|uniref:Uncharacterized protein n=1 Tax=Rubus argutus TaxID=59490 RepID=A0AAW1Y201_RUBAR